MAISHLKTLTVGDFTGTVTVFNSVGNTTTANATDIVRPSDWNSQHVQVLNLGGNTSGTNQLSGADIVFAGGNNITLSGNGSTVFISAPNAGGAGTGFTGVNATGTLNSNGLSLSVAPPGGGGGNLTISAAGSSVSSGSIVLSNSNNVSFGMNGSTITGSASFPAQTQFVLSNSNNVSFGTNASTVTASASFPAQTQFVLSNSNGLTFGTNASTVTASYNSTQFDFASNTTKYAGTGTSATNASITLNSNGLAISVAAPGGGAATVSAYAQSNTTLSTSGSMPVTSMQFAGAGLVSVGVSNGSVVVSGPGTIALPQISVGNSNLGNTLGNTGVVTGQLVLVGSNNITLSGSTNAGSMTISISGGGAGGGGVNIAASNTTFTSGTVNFSVAGGAATINSGAQAVGLSVPATSMLSGQGGVTVSTAGSTVYISAAGANPVFSAGASSSSLGSIIFANSNNVSFGLTTGSQITASASYNSTSGAGTGFTGVNATGTLNSNGLSLSVGVGGGGGVAIAASNSTFTSGTVVLSAAGGALTISNGAQSALFSVPATSSLSATGNASIGSAGNTFSIGANAAAVSLSGNSTSAGAGYSNVSTGTLILAGGNNITLSQNGASVTISGANVGGAQTGISSVAAGGTTYTSGSIQFVNSNSFSFLSTTGQGIVGSFSQSIQTQASGAIAGTGFTSAGAGVGVSGTLSTNGLSLSVTAPTQSNQTGAVFAQGNTFGQSSSSTYDARTLNLSFGPNISGGWSNSSVVISADAYNFIAVPGTTAPADSTVVFSNSNGVTFGLGGANSTVLTASVVTTYAPAVHSHAFSASGGSSAFTTLSFSNVNGVTFSNSAGQVAVTHDLQYTSATSAITAAAFPSANTTKFAGTGTSFGGTNLSGSMTLNSNGLTLSMSAANPGAGGGINIAASNTTFTSGTVVMSASGGAITINSGAQSVGFSVPATSSLVGVNGISIASAGSTISVSNNQWTGQWYQPELAGASVLVTQPNGTLFLRPFELDGYFDIVRVNMLQSFNSSRTTASFSASVSNASSSSGSGSWGLTGTALIFSRANTIPSNASYNSLISYASMTHSMSAGYSASASWNANVSSATCSLTTAYSVGFVSQVGSDGGVTYGNTGTTGTTQFSSTSTNQNSFSSSFGLSGPLAHLSAQRGIFIPAGTGLGSSAVPPGEYWL